MSFILKSSVISQLYSTCDVDDRNNATVLHSKATTSKDEFGYKVLTEASYLVKRAVKAFQAMCRS